MSSIEEKVAYIEKNLRKILTKREVDRLYNKIQEREDRITIPLKSLSYNNYNPIDLKLFMLDRTEVSETKIKFDSKEKDAFHVYALTYNKIAIQYTDDITEEYITVILDIDTGKIIFSIKEENDSKKIGRIAFDNKFYIFYEKHTIVYDVQTNTITKINIEGLERIGIVKLKVMKNKIIATRQVNPVIYEIDVDNRRLITIFKDKGDGSSAYYNGETLIIMKGREVHINDKTFRLSEPLDYGYIEYKWFDDILLIINPLKDSEKSIIKIYTSSEMYRIEESIIDTDRVMGIISPNLVYSIGTIEMILYDLSNIKNTHIFHNEDLRYGIRVLSSTQVLIYSSKEPYTYYLIKDRTQFIKVEELAIGNRFVILPPSPKDLLKTKNNIKTNFISNNIKKLIASFA